MRFNDVHAGSGPVWIHLSVRMQGLVPQCITHQAEPDDGANDGVCGADRQLKEGGQRQPEARGSEGTEMVMVRCPSEMTAGTPDRMCLHQRMEALLQAPAPEHAIHK